jgi:hypothetical protein
MEKGSSTIIGSMLVASNKENVSLYTEGIPYNKALCGCRGVELVDEAYSSRFSSWMRDHLYNNRNSVSK